MFEFLVMLYFLIMGMLIEWYYFNRLGEMGVVLEVFLCK